MNVNNVTMSRVPQNIIRNTFNADKSSFANMLIDAAGKLSSVKLPESNDNILSGDNTSFLLNETDIMKEDEDGKRIDYGGLCGMPDIYFLTPNLLADDMSRNIGNSGAIENQLSYGSGQAGILLGKNTASVKQNPASEKAFVNAESEKIMLKDLTPEKEMPGDVTAEKTMLENTTAEKIMFNNVIAEKTMFESSAPEKTIQKNISTEKIVPENKAEEKTVQDIIEYDFREAALNYMSPVENKIIAVTDESTELKAEILSQVSDKIIITAEKDMLGDTKTISMQLQPQNLGKVDIKLTYENDKLTVEIKALNKETQKILSSNTDELKEMLSKTSSVKIVVKPFVESDTHHYHDDKGNEQYFYQGQEQNQGQGRQRNNYYYRQTKKAEKDVFSELINSNALKEGIIGN